MSNKIKVCSHCLFGIRSREGNVLVNHIHVDESDIEESKCDLCEDTGFSELYAIVKSN